MCPVHARVEDSEPAELPLLCKSYIFETFQFFEAKVLRMAVMGAGALGSLYGALIIESGEDVVLVKRSKDHVETINSRGLRISGVRGDRVIKAEATTDPNTVGQVDLIIFTVKSIDTEQAAKDCLPLVGQRTAILSIQNGVDNIEKIGNIVGREKIVGGSSAHNAVFVEPGHIYHAVDGTTTIGELDGSITKRVRSILHVLQNARMNARVSNNILGVLWTKLLICVSAITLNGIITLPPAEMMKIQELRNIITKTAQEVVNVAVAAEIRLTVDDPIS